MSERLLALFVLMTLGRLGFKRNIRQRIYNIERFQTDGNNAHNEIENIARISTLFSPLIWVVFDAAGVVNGNTIAIHNPLNRAFAVDNILICPIWDARRDCQ